MTVKGMVDRYMQGSFFVFAEGQFQNLSACWENIIKPQLISDMAKQLLGIQITLLLSYVAWLKCWSVMPLFVKLCYNV